MTLHFRVLDEAKQELTEASVWYDAERQDLGREFLVAYRTIIAHAIDFPDTGSPITELRTGQDVRRFLFEPRFPYAVVAARVRDAFVVVAIEHQHRKPLYWRKRLAKVHP